MVNPEHTDADFARAELTLAIRREFAELLRYEANTEPDPKVARRLRALAADFEVSGLWLQR